MPLHDYEKPEPGLARERTRLAWMRTAVAFAATGAVIVRRDLPVGLVVLGLVPLMWAMGRMLDHPSVPATRSRRLLLVTATVTLVSVLALAVALLGRSPASLKQVLPFHG